MPARRRRHRQALALALGAGVMLWLAGCAVEVDNLKPAQEIARQAKPPGSVYVGWRVFQDKCARCHGAAALGTAQAPNLLPRLREMGSRQFVGLVLQRYDWNLPAGAARPQGAEHDALVDSMLLRKAQPLAMPAWQGEPAVNAHITDLYAYLSARAQACRGRSGRRLDRARRWPAARAGGCPLSQGRRTVACVYIRPTMRRYHAAMASASHPARRPRRAGPTAHPAHSRTPWPSR